jgi:hypothetical protein
MTRRKRDELRENVIIAAREDMLSGGWKHQAVHDAVRALDAYEAAPITGAGARYVHGSPETSAAAAGLAAVVQKSARYEVVRFLEHRGRTDDELESLTGRPHQTISSARNWLVQAGWVQDSGNRHKTRSGRPAVVWVLTRAAYEQLKGGI